MDSEELILQLASFEKWIRLKPMWLIRVLWVVHGLWSTPLHQKHSRDQECCLWSYGALICVNTETKDKWLSKFLCQNCSLYYLKKESLTKTFSWSLLFLIQECFVASFISPACVSVLSPETTCGLATLFYSCTINKFHVSAWIRVSTSLLPCLLSFSLQPCVVAPNRR